MLRYLDAQQNDEAGTVFAHRIVMVETSRKTERTGEEAGLTEAAAAGRDQGATRLQRMDRIAARAYELYQRRGGDHGQEMEDWLEAERQIDAGDDDGGATR